MTQSSSQEFDLLIKNANIIDGTGKPEYFADVLINQGKIINIGFFKDDIADEVIDASGYCLAPGFIDVHSHDDNYVLKNPRMTAKISQGVTTVVVGNCGISLSPISLKNDPPDPMNLLGEQTDFTYSNFSNYAKAVEAAQPSTNVAALVGHTTLRANVMDDLSRAATPAEIEKMKVLLEQSLEAGAIGLSSGLAYISAINAPSEELESLMPVLAKHNRIYTTHLRNEFDAIIDALKEAFDTASSADIPLVVSHVKCAGKVNWGRSEEVIDSLQTAAEHQDVACDCYPYSASSSTLDLNQVTDEIEIFIPWSKPHPEMAGQTLMAISKHWNISLTEAAKKLQPAGAVYHCMSEADVETFLKYPLTMVGSDGLPGTPSPHPRLWGAFPRVIKHYCRERKLFNLPEAIHKMTGLSACKFDLEGRGEIKAGNWADIVLFDFQNITDEATFEQPQQSASGVIHVWVNGKLSYSHGKGRGAGYGKLLRRTTQNNHERGKQK